MNSRRRPAPTEFALSPSARRRRAVIVVLALLIATLTVAGYVFRVERDDADRRERDVARQAAQTTDLLLVRGISGLLGARGLVDELGYVDPDGFDAFARAFAGAPGLDGVLLVRRVPANQRDLFRVEIGPPIRDISPSGELVPAGRSPGAFRGRAGRSGEVALKRLLSVDLLSAPEQAQALETALTTAERL